MSRRRPVTLRCAEPDCRESAFYEVRTVAEDRELRSKPWRCVRHSHPEIVLANIGDERGQTLVCVEKSYGRFWFPEGKTTGSGYLHGPGFQAFAEDFQPGTRIHVSAHVLPPLLARDYEATG